jgi:hypothetical protein
MTTVPGTFVGSIPETNPPATFTINGNQWVGKVSNDAKSHTLTTVTPFVQVITVNTTPPYYAYYNLPNVPFQRGWVCVEPG